MIRARVLRESPAETVRSIIRIRPKDHALDYARSFFSDTVAGASTPGV